ncbi:MAG: CaiB/BaiF CoA-transferase family protein [Betaproteobacteria bacterium]
MSGPLKHLRIIEFAGIGPAPFGCMMLADNGADVIRVTRTTPSPNDEILDPSKDILARSRRVVRLDLKNPEDVATARRLVRSADAVVEGFRPGVMESLGLGPAELMADHPALVVARMTGWGQDGPLAFTAGHDINYIAVAGALHAFGRAGDKPTPPVNLVGDFGGGGMLLAFGIVSAVLHARATGQGQVIDCAMVDGAASLMGMVWSLRAAGMWKDERGVNLLDTGAYFYDTYETSDARHIAIGAVEPHFHARLLDALGLADDLEFRNGQRDPRAWPRLKERLTAIFLSRTRDQWRDLLEPIDACFAAVLSMDEAPRHPHNVARGLFQVADGVMQPSPVPRYSQTPCDSPRMTPADRDDSQGILAELDARPSSGH